jgi:predicted  nucleic acid-binding Zn-ribbon protein
VPVMDNPFLCTNGHSFTANAKIRARCPSCGAMARRNFKEESKSSTTEEEHTEHNERHKPIEHPLILRQGRTPVATAKKRSPAQLANDKRLSEMRKKASNAKPSTTRKSAVGNRVANGLVKTQRVTRPSIPGVTKRPQRTAVAGQLRNLPAAKPKSFMDQVIDTFKIF